MKNRTVIRMILLLLTAANLAFIFVMSAEDAERSSNTSKSVGYSIAGAINEDFEKMPEPEKKTYVESIDDKVRKSAHILEFAALGALLYADIYVFGISGLPGAGLSVAAGAAFAAFDEIHQLFVEGRGAQLTDILIDTAGAAAGCAVSFLVIKLIAYITAKKRGHAV